MDYSIFKSLNELYIRRKDIKFNSKENTYDIKDEINYQLYEMKIFEKESNLEDNLTSYSSNEPKFVKIRFYVKSIIVNGGEINKESIKSTLDMRDFKPIDIPRK